MNPPTCASEWRGPASFPSTRTQLVLASCACAGATAFLYAVDPARHAVYPQCQFYKATGLYCAGCGATRAAYALLHGRVLVALQDNALFVALLPVMIYVAAAYALSAWRNNVWPQIVLQPRALIWMSLALFALMAGFMVIRNLPGFEWLRPIS